MLDDCHAKRWKGAPAFDGDHPPHLFTYGPHGMYTGSCKGREFSSPFYERCTDPACPVAYVYAREQNQPHWHYKGVPDA